MNKGVLPVSLFGCAMCQIFGDLCSLHDSVGKNEFGQCLVPEKVSEPVSEKFGSERFGFILGVENILYRKKVLLLVSEIFCPCLKTL